MLNGWRFVVLKLDNGWALFSLIIQPFFGLTTTQISVFVEKLINILIVLQFNKFYWSLFNCPN